MDQQTSAVVSLGGEQTPDRPLEFGRWSAFAIEDRSDDRASRGTDGPPGGGRHHRLIAETDHDRVVAVGFGRPDSGLERVGLTLGPARRVDDRHVLWQDIAEIDGAGDDVDLVEAGSERRPDGMDDDRLTVQQREQLVLRAGESGTGPGGEDDGGNGHAPNVPRRIDAAVLWDAWRGAGWQYLRWYD